MYYHKEKLKQLNDDELSFAVSINLLDSAFNILQHPFELLRNKKSIYFKEREFEGFDLLASFQSIVTAIELIMKSRIASESWTYLFSKTKTASKDSLIDGDFRSINFENCIDALNKYCNIEITDKIKTRIEEIRIIRNKLTHYYCEYSKDQVLNYVAFGLDIYRFLSNIR